MNSSVVESSEESTVECRPNSYYCILHGKCSHSMDSCKDLRTMIIKHKQKKSSFETYRKSSKELYLRKISTNLKRSKNKGRQKNSSNIFRKCRSLMIRTKRVSQVYVKTYYMNVTKFLKIHNQL